MRSPVIKLIVIAGHKTSVSLEDAFWLSLKDIAMARHITLSDLVASLDAERRHRNLSSAIRLFVLDYYRSNAEGLDLAAASGARDRADAVPRTRGVGCGIKGRLPLELDDFAGVEDVERIERALDRAQTRFRALVRRTRLSYISSCPDRCRVRRCRCRPSPVPVRPAVRANPRRAGSHLGRRGRASAACGNCRRRHGRRSAPAIRFARCPVASP